MCTRWLVLTTLLLAARTAAAEEGGTYSVNSNEPEAYPLHLAAGVGFHLPVKTEGVLIVPVQGAYDLGNRVHVGGRISIPVKYLSDPKHGFFDAEVGGALYALSGRTAARLSLFSGASGEAEDLRRRNIGVRGGLKLFKTRGDLETTPSTYADVGLTMVIGYVGLDMLWRENFDIDTANYGNKATTRMVDWYVDVLYALSGSDAGGQTIADGTTKLGARFGINWIGGHPLGMSLQTELGSMPGIKGDIFGMLSIGVGSNIL